MTRTSGVSDVVIIVSEQAFRFMEQFARGDTSRERGGVLVGRHANDISSLLRAARGESGGRYADADADADADTNTGAGPDADADRDRDTDTDTAAGAGTDADGGDTCGCVMAGGAVPAAGRAKAGPAAWSGTGASGRAEVGAGIPRRPGILVVGAIEARFSEAKRTSLTFTHETWQYIGEVMEQRYPGERIVGWFHTHPGFGVFLSGHDMFIQKHFFDQPWQVAYVIDPVAQSRGFFRWEGGEVVPCEDFLILGRDGTLATCRCKARARARREVEGGAKPRPGPGPRPTEPVPASSGSRTIDGSRTAPGTAPLPVTGDAGAGGRPSGPPQRSGSRRDGDYLQQEGSSSQGGGSRQGGSRVAIPESGRSVDYRASGPTRRAQGQPDVLRPSRRGGVGGARYPDPMPGRVIAMAIWLALVAALIWCLCCPPPERPERPRLREQPGRSGPSGQDGLAITDNLSIEVGYRVQPGDTLWGISAYYYGTGTRYRELALRNGLPDPDRIYYGTVLVVPLSE